MGLYSVKFCLSLYWSPLQQRNEKLSKDPTTEKKKLQTSHVSENLEEFGVKKKANIAEKYF